MDNSENFKDNLNEIKQKNIHILSFIGFSRSGKTTSIESIVNYLSKFKSHIVVLKNIHQENFTIDTPGKNTWRYTQAGANIVVSHSKKESAIMINKKLSLEKLFKLALTIYEITEEKNTEYRFIIFEGFREIQENKVLCVKDTEEIIKQIDKNVTSISGSIFSDENELLKSIEYYPIPFINIKENPEKISKLLNITLTPQI